MNPIRKDWALSPEQRADARTALQLLEGTNLTLTEAAEIAARGRRATLRWTIDTAIAEFHLEKARSGMRPRSIEWYEEKLTKISRIFGARRMDEIKRPEFRQAMKQIPASNRPTLVRAARALWRWAIIHEPQIAVEDITAGLLTQSKAAAGDAAVFTPAQVQAILEGAGRYRSALALMFFAGVRPEEIAGRGKDPLLWSHVNVPEKILRIPANIAKTGKPRILQGLPVNQPAELEKRFLPSTLWPWLQPGDPKEPVCPARTRQAIETAQKITGIWPHDVTRHTFATYALAYLADAGLVSEWLGHEGKPTLLHTRYKGLARYEQAAEFWAIKP